MRQWFSAYLGWLCSTWFVSARPRALKQSPKLQVTLVDQTTHTCRSATI